ncbi:hypothetical protein [Actinoplanes subglobosus]|uniref:Recombinase domain-containing protein n=1 Tax=Actinoplanes subglobosus TaxID=1547892 RepID=A0ABV8IM69_9ACTN
MATRAARQRPEVSAGMAAARGRGVRLGRPAAVLPTWAVRAGELRDQGLSLAAIANTLDSEKVPTLSGQGSWSKSSVQYLLRRLDDQLAPSLAATSATASES